MSLRFRILLLVALATFVPTALFGLHLLEQRDSQIAEARRGLAALASYGGEDLANKVSGTVQLLYGLSRAADLATGNRDACSAFLADALRRYPQYTGLLTITPQGQLHCDSLRSGRSLDLNDRAYFRQALGSADPTFEPVFGRLTGIAVLQVAYPVRDGPGTLKYVLLASLNLVQFGARLAMAGAHPQMSVLIWDDKGNLLVRQPEDGTKLAGTAHAQSPLYRFVRDAPAGETAELPGPDEIERVWALSVLPGAAGSGLRLTLGIPREILLARADHVMRQAAATLAGVSLAVFVAALLFAELGIRRHLRRIATVASLQRAGEFDARIGGAYPQGELGELMRTLDSSAAAVQAQQAEISSQSEQLARANRTLRMLSAVSSAIVRIHERDALLVEACRIAAVEGRFPVAWAGLFDHGSPKMTPIASHGVERSGLVAGLESTIAPGSVSALLLHERKAVVVTDAAPGFAALAGPAALALGSRSLAAFPLDVSGDMAGLLVLHAHESGFFDSAEMARLGELAGDIAFALEHIEKSERLDYLARYDPLTGLANRSLFLEHLRHSLADAARDGEKFALVLADVERFQRVNDTLGRAAGDELLRQIAARAATVVRNHQCLARIGVDLFAYISLDFEEAGSAGRRVERADREIFGQPFIVGGAELRIAARFGIAVYPGDGNDAESLIRNAEAALKRAKGSPDRVLFYESEMSERVAEKLALENKLRLALSRREFVLHYQPKVEVGTRDVTGVEALIRWNSPGQGLVQPLEFIPLLEETGLIVEVGDWVLRQAVQDQQAWREANGRAPRIAVNVSPIQLHRRDFVRSIEAVIGEADPRTAIDLEITETHVMEDIEENIGKLRAVHALGVDIAIDDFGTGHSSLAYLAKLPVQALKIDRSFIVALLSDRHTMTMVSTIISLAQSLRLTVIAEGVESEEQARTLNQLRCHQFQGYLFSRPLPQAGLLAMLERLQAANRTLA